MPTPTLLLPFEGSLAGQSRSGSVLATSDSAVSYVTGANASRQAASPQSENRIYGPASTINRLTGSVVFRYRRRATVGTTLRYVISAGSTINLSTFFIGVRMADTGISLRTAVEDGTTLFAVAPPAVGTWAVGYVGWTQDRWEAALAGGAIQSSARTAGLTNPPASFVIGGTSIGTGYDPQCDYDDVLLFDRPLTSAEFNTLKATDAWDWTTLAPARPATVLTIGSSHVGPLRVGKD
jgi:hypothetical protein